MPAFTIAALLGVVTAVRARGFSWLKALPLLLLAVYGLLYLGSGGTWGANGSSPTFDTAILRYWLLFFTMMFFLAVYGVTKTKDTNMKVILLLGIVLTGPLSVYTLTEGSVLSVRDSIQRQADWAETRLLPNTEEDALIFASRSDKRIVPYRDVATWWNGEEFYDSEIVATSMARVAATGKPVYLYREREVNLPELRDALADHNYTAVEIKGTGLYRIRPASDGQ
jgi:hypothetical protein